MSRKTQITALALAAGAFSSAALAGDLGWPVACRPGETCFIQHYLDHDPGPEGADAGCGSLSYDGHDGTDIALPSAAAMAAGVEVRAALAGRVKAIRDGLPDGAPFPEGQDCGNGLLIVSGERELQYCHLRNGSVAPRPGQSVAAGEALGLVGQSGNADFPHLHLTVRDRGQPVDPFGAGCGATDGHWADPLAYVPGGLVQVGISDAIPDYDAVKRGNLPAPRAHAGALVLWGEVFGARPGDVLDFDLTGPEGAVHRGAVTLDRRQDRSFRAVGRRIDLPPGIYQGRVTLTRAGVEIDAREVSVTLR